MNRPYPSSPGPAGRRRRGLGTTLMSVLVVLLAVVTAGVGGATLVVVNLIGNMSRCPDTWRRADEVVQALTVDGGEAVQVTYDCGVQGELSKARFDEAATVTVRLGGDGAARREVLAAAGTVLADDGWSAASEDTGTGSDTGADSDAARRAMRQSVPAATVPVSATFTRDDFTLVVRAVGSSPPVLTLALSRTHDRRPGALEFTGAPALRARSLTADDSDALSQVPLLRPADVPDGYTAWSRPAPDPSETVDPSGVRISTLSTDPDEVLPVLPQVVVRRAMDTDLTGCTACRHDITHDRGSFAVTGRATAAELGTCRPIADAGTLLGDVDDDGGHACLVVGTTADGVEVLVTATLVPAALAGGDAPEIEYGYPYAVIGDTDVTLRTPHFGWAADQLTGGPDLTTPEQVLAVFASIDATATAPAA